MELVGARNGCARGCTQRRRSGLPLFIGSYAAGQIGRGGGRGTRTFELFVELAARGDGEGADELLKVDCAVAVVVEYIEDEVCKLSGISKGEELFVDAAEFFLVEFATRTVS